MARSFLEGIIPERSRRIILAGDSEKDPYPYNNLTKRKISYRVGGMERNYEQVCQCLWLKEWRSNKNTTTSFLPKHKLVVPNDQIFILFSKPLTVLFRRVKIMTWLVPQPDNWLHHSIAYWIWSTGFFSDYTFSCKTRNHLLLQLVCEVSGDTQTRLRFRCRLQQRLYLRTPKHHVGPSDPFLLV